LSSGDANRQISELKFKLVKSEQEVTALEQNVSVSARFDLQQQVKEGWRSLIAPLETRSQIGLQLSNILVIEYSID